MPVGFDLGEADDAQAIYVSVMVKPREGLPVKEWQIELHSEATVGDVKHALFAEYGVEKDFQRLSSTHHATDPGLKDNVQIYDLPNHGGHEDVKDVFLLPAPGKETALLDRVLEWAEEANCYEDYAKAGAVKSGTPVDAAVNKKSSLRSMAAGPGVLWQNIQQKRGMARQSTMKVSGTEGNLSVEMEESVPFCDLLPFNLVTSFLCFVNMLVIGFEADFSCWADTLRGPCPPADRMSWYVVECVFTLIFIVEVALRVALIGPIHYFMGDPITHPSGLHFPNVVDFLVVFVRALDTFAFQQAGFDTKIKIISCFRIVQFARVARLMRLVKSLRELWLLCAGMADLFKTVLWVMLLLVLIFWVVAIIVTIVIGQDEEYFDYTHSEWSKNDYFASVPKSMYSLFQVMTLAKWSSGLFRPVLIKYPGIFIIVVPFLCITTVGLLNIIVGVVVENTLASASSNREREGKELQKMHAKVMESMKNVFEEADTDGGGMLDREELKKTLRNPRVRDRLKILDIPPKDLNMLFDTLDEEQVGEIPTDKFFRGCSRLRGPALACDMHRMSIDFNRYITWTDALVDSTKGTNEKLESLLREMESVDRDIIKGEDDAKDPVLSKRRERSIKRGSEALVKRRGSSALDLGSGNERRSTKRVSFVRQSLEAAMSNIGIDMNSLHKGPAAGPEAVPPPPGPPPFDPPVQARPGKHVTING